MPPSRTQPRRINYGFAHPEQASKFHLSRQWKDGEKGTVLYQQVQRMKRAYCLSNINQVLYKYMDDKNTIKLPDGTCLSTSTDVEMEAAEVQAAIIGTK